MPRITRLLLIPVLLLSFAAVGCPQGECDKLRLQLLELQNRILEISRDRAKADERGDMSAALELFQAEKNARRNFAELAEQYISKGCEELSGRVPVPPPMNPATEIESP